MTNEQNELPNIDTDSQEHEQTLTLGVLLKAAREKQGATIADIAAQLHLRASIVEKIEADSLNDIAAATYVRGYVKNFARIVQADKNNVQACLDKQLPVATEPKMQSFSRKTTREARDSRLMLVTYLIAFVLLALLVLWWFQKSSMETDVDFSQPTVEEVAASGETSSDVPAADVTIDATTIEGAGSGIDDAVVDVALNASAAGGHPSSPEASLTLVESQVGSAEDAALAGSVTVKQIIAGDNSPAQLSVLNLALSGDCWIKIADAKGKTLVDGLKASGRQINVSGVEPFSVILGAPQVVSIQLNDNNISLDEFPSGKVARLTLPLAG